MPRAIAIATLFLALVAVISANGAVDSSVSPDRHFIQDVPFTSQLPNYCGPASLSSLLAFYGICASQETIGSIAYDKVTNGTNGADLLYYCIEKGLSAYSLNSTLQELKGYISKGYPVIVLQDRSRSWTEGHFRVAVGYDDAKGTITLRDSTQPGYAVLPYTEFDRLWAKRGRWALLAMPKEKDKFPEKLGKCNAVLHMDLAQAYLHRGACDKAKAECQLALQIEPGNPHIQDLIARSERAPVRHL